MSPVPGVGFLLKLITDSVGCHINNDLRSLDLTMSQARIIGYISRSERGCATQKELESFFCVKHPTMVGLLQRLESKGFVRIATDPADRRCHIVYLTEKGVAFHQKKGEQVAQTEILLTDGFSDSEREQLKDLLIRVYRNLNDGADPPAYPIPNFHSKEDAV